ncbi:MAG: hypothetical protein WCY09_08195 [Candidatus Omnitrophota bacterium]
MGKEDWTSMRLREMCSEVPQQNPEPLSQCVQRNTERELLAHSCTYLRAGNGMRFTMSFAEFTQWGENLLFIVEQTFGTRINFAIPIDHIAGWFRLPDWWMKPELRSSLGQPIKLYFKSALGRFLITEELRGGRCSSGNTLQAAIADWIRIWTYEFDGEPATVAANIQLMPHPSMIDTLLEEAGDRINYCGVIKGA